MTSPSSYERLAGTIPLALMIRQVSERVAEAAPLALEIRQLADSLFDLLEQTPTDLTRERGWRLVGDIRDTADELLFRLDGSDGPTGPSIEAAA